MKEVIYFGKNLKQCTASLFRVWGQSIYRYWKIIYFRNLMLLSK